MAKRKLTAARRRISRLPRDQLCRLTAAEKRVKGLGPHALHVVPKGAKVSKRTATLPLSTYKDIRAVKGGGLAHSAAAKERRAAFEAGSEPIRAPYETASGREGAHKRFANTAEDKRLKAIHSNIDADRLKEPQYHRNHYRKTSPPVHVFINRNGVEQRASFYGAPLATMQNYRKDVGTAKRLNSSEPLEKYEGGVLDHRGTRVYPSTDIDQIRRAERSMTATQRRRFEAEQFYSSPMVMFGIAA